MNEITYQLSKAVSFEIEAAPITSDAFKRVLDQLFGPPIDEKIINNMRLICRQFRQIIDEQAPLFYNKEAHEVKKTYANYLRVKRDAARLTGLPEQAETLYQWNKWILNLSRFFTYLFGARAIFESIPEVDVSGLNQTYLSDYSLYPSSIPFLKTHMAFYRLVRGKNSTGTEFIIAKINIQDYDSIFRKSFIMLNNLALCVAREDGSNSSRLMASTSSLGPILQALFANGRATFEGQREWILQTENEI